MWRTLIMGGINIGWLADWVPSPDWLRRTTFSSGVFDFVLCTELGTPELITCDVNGTNTLELFRLGAVSFVGLVEVWREL